MAISPLDRAVSARIALLRYPLIYLMVVLHVPTMTGFNEDPGIKAFIGGYFDLGLVRLSIPMLSCISGFLIFHLELDRNFALLIRKRSYSLLLPMVIWNLPLVVLLYFVQAFQLTSYEFNSTGQMYPFEPMRWINGVFAVSSFPIVGPMHFMRDLYVVSFLAPLMGWVIRRAPLTGLIVLIAIFYRGLDGEFIRSNTIPIMFYLGAMAAVKQWDLKLLDRFALPSAIVVLVICAVAVLLDIGRPAWLPLISPLLVWPAASLLVGSRAGRWLAVHGQVAVFLFMFHGLVLIFLLRAFPDYQSGEYEFWIWLAGPMLITIGSHQLFLILRRFSPGLLTLLVGGRKTG